MQLGLGDIKKFKEDAVKNAWESLGSEAGIWDVFQHAANELCHGIPAEKIENETFAEEDADPSTFPERLPPLAASLYLAFNILARDELLKTELPKHLNGEDNLVERLRPQI
jgi:hypothetical protein